MLSIETTWPETGTTPWLTVTPTTPTTKDGPEEDATAIKKIPQRPLGERDDLP